jgi:hypothetical protein
MVTVNSHVFLGRITPVFGRTQYLFGDVVLTLKATYSLDLLTRWTVHELCFFTSTENQAEKRGSDFKNKEEWRQNSMFEMK